MVQGKICAQDTYEDELTYTSLGYTSTATSYSNFAVTSGMPSGVSYAGNIAPSGRIQMRSNNTNSGIISTANPNGLLVKKVTVEWNSETSSGRTINVYGSTSDYDGSNASALYSSSTRGTLLGTIVCGTSTELDISGEYTAIGIRSNSGALYLDKITVTWGTENLLSPALAFSSSSYTYFQGDTFTPPTLTYAEGFDGTLSYTSDNDAVATVNATTGEVTLTGGTGTVTVTASCEATTNFDADEASYTLRVMNPADMIVYRKVTSQDEIHDGGIYLVVDATDTYAMGELSSNGDYRPQVSISDNLADGAIKVISANETGTPYEVTLSEVSGSENTFGMQLANGNYLVKTGSKNTLNESTDGPDASDNAQWTITYGAEAVSIRNVGATEYYIQHNAPNTRFSCYKNTMADVVLYRRVGELTIPTDEGYGTFYTDKAYIMPAGVRGTAVTDVTDGRLATAWEFAEGAEVPTRTPLLLNGPKGTHTYIVLGATQATAPSVNYLRGSVEAETTTGADVYYKLTYNSTGDTRTLGFYWGAENGAAFTNAAGKAYLALPAALAAQLKGFAFAGGEATAITQVAQDPDASAAVYTLSGVRMPAGLSALPKGVYIVNGKKVMK